MVLLPVTLTTRNRSLRDGKKGGGAAQYLDRYTDNLEADGWRIRTPGVNLIETKHERRLTFSDDVHGKLLAKSTVYVDVVFEFKWWFSTLDTPPIPGVNIDDESFNCRAPTLSELREIEDVLNVFIARDDIVYDEDMREFEAEEFPLIGGWLRGKKWV